MTSLVLKSIFVPRGYTNALTFFVLIVLLVCCQIAVAQTKPGPNETYLDYSPGLSAVQAPLGSLAQGVREALYLIRSGKSKEAQTLLERTKQESEPLKSSLGRGYQDEFLFLLGFVEELLGNDKSALALYERSLRLRTDNPQALFRHALLLKKAGRFSEAASEFREVAWRSESAKHEPLFLAAECLLELGRAEEALELTKKAGAVNPHFLPVARRLLESRKQQLATTLDPQKKAALDAQIMSDLRTIVSQDPNDRDAALELARRLITGADPLVQPDRFEEASSLARTQLANSGYADAEMVKVLFDAELRRGNNAAAEEVLEKGLAENPDSEVLKQAQKQLDVEHVLAGEKAE